MPPSTMPPPGQLDPELEEIHIITLQGDIEAMERLLSARGELVIKEQTAQGETPLMLAALMGHTEITGLLLKKGANRMVKNKFLCDALAYTTMSGLSIARREFFRELGFPEKCGAQHNRNIIAAVLATPSPVPPQHHFTHKGIETGPIFFRRTSTDVETFLRIGHLSMPKQSRIDPRRKVVGYIHTQADLSPRAWSISGYSDICTDNKDINPMLNPKTWTTVAKRLFAPVIGFIFKPHKFDSGWQKTPLEKWKVGRFEASHVEVKLAAWYCCSLMKRLNFQTDWNSKTSITNCLLELQKRSLGDARYAVINITEKPCPSCANFLVQLEQFTGIKFRVNPRRCLAMVPPQDTLRKSLLAHEVQVQNEDGMAHLDGNGLDDMDVEPELPEDDQSDIIRDDPLENCDFGMIRHHHKQQPDPRSPITSLSRSSDGEYYADDAIDGNYHGRSETTRSWLPRDGDGGDQNPIMDDADNDVAIDPDLRSISRASSVTIPDIVAPEPSANPVSTNSSLSESRPKRQWWNPEIYQEQKVKEVKKRKLEEMSQQQASDVSGRRKRNLARHQEVSEPSSARILSPQVYQEKPKALSSVLDPSSVSTSPLDGFVNSYFSPSPGALQSALERIRGFACP
jgi:hypothetical protein